MATKHTKSPHSTFLLIFSVFLFTHSQATTPKLKFPASVFHSQKKNQQSSVSEPSNLYREEFFTQILDHFTYTPQSYQTFQQRYLINDTYWTNHGAGDKNNPAPIFVYAGNEGGIEWFARNTGFMLDIAPRFNALLVFIEHRFYGKSIPFGGDKQNAYNDSRKLGYLSSTQALADFATLIVDLKKNLSATESPVVVFGGSYGGMLAAWFRLKYPHIVIGALASSAPILDFDDLTSPYSFNSIVTRDFKSESESCYRTIKDSWDLIAHRKAQPGGVDMLQSSFRFCNRKEDVRYLSGWLGTAWVYTAMTDYPTASNFLAPMPAYPVREMCRAIDDPKTGNDSFAKLYAAASVYYNYTGSAGSPCFDLDDGDDSGSQDLGSEGWGWQACTEMVMPQGASDDESIFPVSTWSPYNSSCDTDYDIFPRSNWITTEFGGHKIKQVLKRYGSNIIFFNGLRDPWSGGGVLDSISSSIVAIVAEKGAHHVDLRSATSEDPEWLREVRNLEIKIIGKWLAQYYSDMGRERPNNLTRPRFHIY
ncbi:Lysosomal Pro-X carboxypeptidase [Linum perenne]